MANGQPDDKHLPDTKKEALKTDLGNKVARTLTDAYRDLRKHEVSKGDARDIVSHGVVKGTTKYSEDTNKE